tara:strand:+ start:184 stop:495 length:312 start_codon:yes stop_codon:yes gene_type:complete
MQTTKPMPILLAEKFTELLRATLTPSEFAEMADANANETNPGICHSHDYCDANQIMLDAFEATEMVNDYSHTLWSDAWTYAREELFTPEKCRNGKPIDKCTCC